MGALKYWRELCIGILILVVIFLILSRESGTQLKEVTCPDGILLRFNILNLLVISLVVLAWGAIAES